MTTDEGGRGRTCHYGAVDPTRQIAGAPRCQLQTWQLRQLVPPALTSA